MITINTGDNGGSQGPWIAWQAQASKDGLRSPASFYLRTKEGTEPFDKFAGSGVIMDFANIRVGWQHPVAAKGQAPIWQWWPAPDQPLPRPEKVQTPNGAKNWPWGFSVPCAIGGGETATWEQASAAIQMAVEKLNPSLQQGPGDGSLPLIRCASHEYKEFTGQNHTNIPLLEIVKWVPRPDCLKEGYSVDTASAPAPQSAPPQQAQQAAPAEVPADAEF